MGCGIAAAIVIVLGVIAAFVVVPKMWKAGKEGLGMAMEEAKFEEQRAKLLAAWRAPEGEALFPAMVGGQARTAVTTVTEVPAVGLPAAGRHASYTVPGGSIDVYFFPANDLEKEGIVRKFSSAYESSSGGTKTTLKLGSREMYSAPAIGENHLIRTPDGVLLFRPSSDLPVSGFTVDYLLATAPAAPAAPEAPEAPEPPTEPAN